MDSTDLFETLCNIFYPTIMSIGVSGNLMVIIVIVKMKDMHCSTNIFLANLAIADLMVLLIWGTVQLIDNNIELGIVAYSEKICNATLFFMEAVYSASVLTILAIGFERYHAICKPLEAKYICTRNRAYRICLLTWPLAALFASPHLFIRYQAVQYNEGTYITTVCQKPTDSSLTEVYYIFFPLAFYLLPLIILTVFYSIIAKHLKVTAALNVNIAAITHRQHVVRMLAAVIIVFFVCHLPIRVVSLLYYFLSTDLITKMGVGGFESCLLCALIMLFLQSIVNPILYNFMSKRFRAGFKNICCNFKTKRLNIG